MLTPRAKKITPWLPGCAMMAVLLGWGLIADGPLEESRSVSVSPAAVEDHFKASSREAGLALDTLLHELEEKVHMDPQAAMQQAAAIRDKALRQLVLSKICYELAEINPREAVMVAHGCHLQKEVDWVVRNLVEQWAETDMKAACAWALDQPAGDDRDALVVQLTCLMSRENPFAAATMARTEISAGQAQHDALDRIVQQWAASDPKGALAWVNNFSEPVMK